MPRFGINAQVPLQETCLDSTARADGGAKRIRLSYFSPERKDAPQLGTLNERLFRIQDVVFDQHKHQTSFTLEAVKGAAGTAYIYDKTANFNEVMLRVVIGPVKNHADFKVDLLAEVLGRSEDPAKLRTYQAILNGDNNKLGGAGIYRKEGPLWDDTLKDQPLKQITDKAREREWNCGASLEDFGVKKLGRDHFASYGNTPYYKPYVTKPGKTTKVEDIVFDKGKLRRGVENIHKLLLQGKAVTIFVVHDPGFVVVNGVIQARSTTHYLQVIGCDHAGKRFLVADPWPGGCRLMYQSGIFGNVDSAFLGILRYDEQQNVFSSPVDKRGRQNYVVLTGP